MESLCLRFHCSPSLLLTLVGSSSLNTTGTQVREALKCSYRIAPQDSANPDERRLIYTHPTSFESDDRGYAEPISEEDYNADVSDAFWQIQTIYEEAIWQKLNRNRNMFQAKIVLNSSGLRLRNPNEAFSAMGFLTLTMANSSL